MPILKAYTHDKPPFTLEADLELRQTEILIEYKLSDARGLLSLSAQNQSYQGEEVPREDGLWAATCFEAFLKPAGSENYYEFNFALSPAWQAYQLDSYRQPQPPTVTSDFVLKTLRWQPAQGLLRVRLENNSGHSSFHVGLTAIVVEKSGLKHYFALTHKGDKPDFHLSESFTLLRGATS